MAYGTIKVDTVTFTNDGVDKSVTLSGLVQNPTFSGNVTVTGTLSGVTVTGTTANFTSGNFTNISGGTHTITSGVFAAGSAASPSITFTGDLNTGIYSPGADQVAISTGGSPRVTVTSTGVGISTTSPSQLLHVASALTTGGATPVTWSRSGGATGYLIVDGSGAGIYSGGAFSDSGIYLVPNDRVSFSVNGSERFRCDSSGRLLVGTSSARSTGTLGTNYQALIEKAGDYAGFSVFGNKANNQGSYFVLGKSRGTTAGAVNAVAADDVLGYIGFEGTDGTSSIRAADIFVAVDGTPGTNDMPGRLVFSTTADGFSSPSARMVIKNNGNILIGTTTDLASLISCESWGYGAKVGQIWNHTSSIPSGSADVIAFDYQSTTVGKISITTTATIYSTSSDYRLKENIIAVTDGITRLQQLKPSRFNFIADPSQTVDGFIAHEVQAVVPEAITGSKDETDADGNPIYQGIDQSKLVPVLTAALQEAVAKIESLEARLTAAGI